MSSYNSSGENGDRSNNTNTSTSAALLTSILSRSGRTEGSTASEIEYCLQTLKLLITKLRLRDAPQPQSLEELTMELLLRIHCELLGMDYTGGFIPSATPEEDAERIILSLKDSFGKDTFTALEADKIALKDPQQLRFLMENYELIYKYKHNKNLLRRRMRKGKKAHLKDFSSIDHTTTSDANDDVSHPSDATETESNSNGDYAPSSSDYETVDNIEIGVFSTTTSDKSESEGSGNTQDPSMSSAEAPNNLPMSVERPLSSSPKPGAFEYLPSDPRTTRWSHPGSPIPDISSIKDSPSHIINRTLNSENTSQMPKKNSAQPKDRKESLVERKSGISPDATTKSDPHQQTPSSYSNDLHSRLKPMANIPPLSGKGSGNTKDQAMSSVKTPNNLPMPVERPLSSSPKPGAPKNLPSDPRTTRRSRPGSAALPGISPIKDSQSFIINVNRTLLSENSTQMHKKKSTQPKDRKESRVERKSGISTDATTKSNPRQETTSSYSNDSHSRLKPMPNIPPLSGEGSGNTQDQSISSVKPSDSLPRSVQVKRPLSSSPKSGASKYLPSDPRSTVRSRPGSAAIPGISPIKDSQSFIINVNRTLLSENTSQMPKKNSALPKVRKASHIEKKSRAFSENASQTPKKNFIQPRETKENRVETKSYTLLENTSKPPTKSSIHLKVPKAKESLVETKSVISPTVTRKSDPRQQTTSYNNDTASRLQSPLSIPPLSDQGEIKKGLPSQEELTRANKTHSYTDSIAPDDSISNSGTRNVDNVFQNDRFSEKPSTTQSFTFSENDSPESEAESEENALSEVRDIHQQIRHQLSESLKSIDNDILVLKSKSSTDVVENENVSKPLPNLKWLMPVDARFPPYHRGLIIPRCRRSKPKKVQSKLIRRPSPVSEKASDESCQVCRNPGFSNEDRRDSVVSQSSE